MLVFFFSKIGLMSVCLYHVLSAEYDTSLSVNELPCAQGSQPRARAV